MNNRLSAFIIDTEDVAERGTGQISSLEVPISSADSFLTDESHLRGRAERLFLPRSESELVSILRSASASRIPVTISGGRTGITGGSVPMGGWLISFDKMRRMIGLRFDPARKQFRLRCQPGVVLDAVIDAVEKKEFMDQDSWSEEDRAALAMLMETDSYVFSPDPTERTATLGGMVACNASGARTLYYGPTRNYVSRLRLLLVDGSIIDLKRGECHASADGGFQLVLPDGRVREGSVPGYVMPRVKNAAGYFAKPGMDLLDLFIGSEGTLAVFSEIEIVLIPAPEAILGVTGFFPSEEEALAFVRAARGERVAGHEMPGLPDRPLALEFFDMRSLNLLRNQKVKQGASSAIPALPEGAHTAVYIELALRGGADAGMEDAAEAMLALLESCGSRSETAWTATTAQETERLKLFRHALPEAINQRIGERAVACPGLTKLGTDFAVPDERLEDMLAVYHSMLDRAGLEYVIFGHIGNNHLHVNILPRDISEHERGNAIYMDLAKQIVDWGGTVSGEHGIGKLKKGLLRLMVGDSGIAAMGAAKRVFDPSGLLNQGNMFDAKAEL